jgi:WD40 repeat protein
LCWFRKSKNIFASGSSSGILRITDIGGEKDDNLSVDDGDGMVRSPIFKESFEPFEQLTSVHVNSDDTLLLSCGYSQSVRICDIQSGKIVRNFSDVSKTFLSLSLALSLSGFM